MTIAPPGSEAELMARAQALAGLRIGDLARNLERRLPGDLRGHKGLVGELIELALGASAGSRPVPDFEHLGIELKSVPLGRDLRPRESTHVCTVAADDLAGQRWASSTVRRKLARVLWVAVEGARDIPLAARRIGAAVLWSPSAADEAVLRADWEEHMELIATGRYAELDGRLGTYLQVRPKAANRRARMTASDSSGVSVPTLPRGFYLRATFTARILAAQP
ncbi:MAG: DNA mismatch repair endonuclease MutH [Gammaproteobacteria bacterium]|nr:DNA mismatch repair endonuclease MutH [Gammaproteobacteria bacterium]MCP5202035.1 DNA mismatch repair endonuclease MutH [Gammaproteobacteria bacterium]